MASNRFPFGVIALVVFGVWLLLQTVVGDLPGRLMSWAKS